MVEGLFNILMLYIYEGNLFNFVFRIYLTPLEYLDTKLISQIILNVLKLEGVNFVKSQDGDLTKNQNLAMEIILILLKLLGCSDLLQFWALLFFC